MNRRITYVLLLTMMLGLLTGCGSGGDTGNESLYFHTSMDAGVETQEEAATEENEAQPELYLIAEIDQIEESLRLYRYENGMEYRYYYGTGTRFYNKYGDRSTVMDFTVGAVITIGEVDSEGILREARVSDAVWTYDNVSRFSVEEERHIFEIADTRYTYDDSIYVFSDDERVDLDVVAQGDTLSIVGLDKKILSVRVTTGQGILELANTELFEGSFLQLGTRIFAEITPDMQLTVEEGTYNLIVANNGWGGNREVTIARGETTVVDLDELKGEGPKLGKIQFVVDVADAVLVLDGEEVDYTDPIEIPYGSHSLGVYANGYDAWERNLYVNSEEATIVIQLKDEEGTEDTQESISTTETGESETSSETSSQSEAEQREEELELLQDLLTSVVL